MKIKASVGRAPKNISLQDFCTILDLRAQTHEEAEFLAWLYQKLIHAEEQEIMKCYNDSKIKPSTKD